MDDKLVRLRDVERWILTEAACIDTPADRDAVVERMRYSIPAVDAVEVARCGQCERRKTFADDFGNYTVCLKWKCFVADDDYCSWGQRREDGDNGKHL